MDNKKIWFVTGASKGLGLSLVKQLLKNGNRVAATSRNAEGLAKAVGCNTKQFLPLRVDLPNESSVQHAIRQTVNTFGRIDVVVNNAGYGLGGPLEEVTDSEIRQHFDVNVFGMLNVIRKAMPYLRNQKSGNIINIGSVSGYVSSGGFGSYNASKFAVVGLSEALAEEVKPFGINVTMVAPGFFRTNFLNSSSVVYAKSTIDEYANIHQLQDYIAQELDGKQHGDPGKAALAIIRIAAEANPPVHLLLGSDAYPDVSEKLAALQKEFDEWKELTCSTDFDTNN